MDLTKLLIGLFRRQNNRNRRLARRTTRWGYQPFTDRRMRRRLGWAGATRLYLQRSGVLLLALVGLIFLLWLISR